MLLHDSPHLLLRLLSLLMGEVPLQNLVEKKQGSNVDSHVNNLPG